MIKIYNSKNINYGTTKSYNNFSELKIRYGMTLEDGLVFHSKLNKISNITETGQNITMNNIIVDNVKGKDCLKFYNSNSYIFSDCPKIVGNMSSSHCIWICSTDNSQGTETSVNNFIMFVFSNGDNVSSRRLIASFYTQNPISASFNFRESSVTGKTNIYDDEWHFIVGIHDEITNINKIYIDGHLEGTNVQELSTNSTELRFGKTSIDSNTQYYGYMREARIYNRVLTENEIRILYNREI